MRRYDIDCELNYRLEARSTLVFKIEAARSADQHIASESLTTLPRVPLTRHVDALGTRTLRVSPPAGDFSIHYRARVEIDRRPGHAGLGETPVEELPLDVLPYLSGSRYVESELLFQDALRWIGTREPGFRRVERICEWVRQNVRYAVGTSLAHGTARDVLRTRTGVCRDYAHVAIALCRALNIPARFVVGHVRWNDPPPDFHALFEAWLGNRWVLFDPTAMAETADVIRIGSGRDAADLPFATMFGPARMTRMNPLVHSVAAEPRVAERRVAWQGAANEALAA